MPWTSSLTGETCMQVANEYQSATGQQWVQSLSNYSLFEVAYKALSSVSDPHDKAEVADALFKVNIEGLAGQLNWTSSKNPAPGVVDTPCVGVQWKPSTQVGLVHGGRRQHADAARAAHRRPSSRPTPDRMANPLLELDRVTKRFGRVVIAEDLSFAVGPGDTVGIVGPNGAGKTSLFGLISGDLSPGAGQISFAGRQVTKLDAAARCRLGIGRTYQVPRPFTDMTVFENVLVAAQQGAGLRRRASYAAAAQALERTGMPGEANWPAARLGLLQRKRLELARALASGPKLLLLDEVAGGLTDPEVAQLVEIVRGVNAEGVAVIWIEHVVRALTAVVSRLICLAGGSFVGDGDPAAVLADPAVREVFLGTAGHRVADRRRPWPRSSSSSGTRDPRTAIGAEREFSAERCTREQFAHRRCSRTRGAAQNGTPLLEVRDLTVHHGQLRALDHVSLRVFPGEVYAIIGANGAGKSTLLRTIAGLHRATEGSILFDGKDLTGVRPERRATQGIVMVPEGRRLFGSLTVEENLKVGATYARKGQWTIERVYELFGWMQGPPSPSATAQLSGGEQQSVAIGRALVANPRVLLLDELSLGLAPVVVQRIYAMLPQILATGLTVLLVEQDVSQALRVASHIQCLLEGRTTLEGRPADVTARAGRGRLLRPRDSQPGQPGTAGPAAPAGPQGGEP